MEIVELIKPLYRARKWAAFVGLMLIMQALFLAFAMLEQLGRWIPEWLSTVGMIVAFVPSSVGEAFGWLSEWYSVVGLFIAGGTICLAVLWLRVVRNIHDAYSNNDDSAMMHVYSKIRIVILLLSITLLISMSLGLAYVLTDN